MTKSKVVERITPAQEKSKAIAIKEDAVTSKGKTSELPTTTSKGKGKRPISARKTITPDPNIPSWARGFCRAVHVFLADSHSTGLGEFGTAVPPEVTLGTDAEAQGEASGIDAQAQSEASGTDAQTDRATA
uniref:Integrase core domain containing protein n=1 Tax=Solanum tuberosum TaxID=4113 RepID=M1DJ74_SOLTU